MDVALAHRIGRRLTPRNPADLAKIQSAREEHADPRVRSRLTVLWSKSLGKTHQLIAELVGYSTRQVLRILQLYARQGLENVMTCGELGRPSAIHEHRSGVPTLIFTAPEFDRTRVAFCAGAGPVDSASHELWRFPSGHRKDAEPIRRRSPGATGAALDAQVPNLRWLSLAASVEVGR